LPWQET